MPVELRGKVGIEQLRHPELAKDLYTHFGKSPRNTASSQLKTVLCSVGAESAPLDDFVDRVVAPNREVAGGAARRERWIVFVALGHFQKELSDVG